ncbi:MAG TPA: hypothetical protein PLU10_04910, partial [Chitinophagaceae bacterium]|nr:hypothetical protein [Chitinophagaceae bacterium]
TGTAILVYYMQFVLRNVFARSFILLLVATTNKYVRASSLQNEKQASQGWQQKSCPTFFNF